MARAPDLRDLLETGVVYFPGTVDKLCNPLIFLHLQHIHFLENCSSNQLKTFFKYFVSISKPEVQENGFALLIDCTKGNPRNLPDVLDIIHDYFPAPVVKIYIVQQPTDEGIIGRTYTRFKSLLSQMQGNVDYPTHSLNGYSDISSVVELTQLPSFFGGLLNFDNELWVETRIELEQFISDKDTYINLITTNQECLIQPIPNTLEDLNWFQELIEPLRVNYYVPTQQVCMKGAELLKEIRITQSGDAGTSRFQFCPLSTIHKIDSTVIQSCHDRLSEINENFINLWGLQLQKTYLEKFTISSSVIIKKFTDLESTVFTPFELTLSNVESQFHFYSSIHTTLTSDDKILYENAISSHTCLRDWNFTQQLPTDDLELQVADLNNKWVQLTTVVNERKRIFGYYNQLKHKIVTMLQDCDEHSKVFEEIKVSEDVEVNIALPANHLLVTDELKKLNDRIKHELGEVDVEGTVSGNINVSHINNIIQKINDKGNSLYKLNNQCLAIKEQLSLFFSYIKDIREWINSIGIPFITSETLGTNLEESKFAKTKFLKFIATSGLDGTKMKISQCSKTLNLVLNSQFISDISVNFIKDTFSKTEQEWKRFGLDVQEHGRDLELSIEFYEAAASVSTWLQQEQDTQLKLVAATEEVDDDFTDIQDTWTKFSKLKQEMKETSDVMDVCHSKYIALSASSNSTLRHIRRAKTSVDQSWTKFSEKIRIAEKEIEKKYKSHLKKNDENSKSDGDSSSVGSLEFENDVDHIAFRNTKMLIQELINTEKSYVEDMRDIVIGYKQKIETHPLCHTSLRKHSNTIFGNIEEIYNFHSKIFLGELERSQDTHCVGSTFCNNASNFDMYAAYCKNKPHSENFLSTADDLFLIQCQKDLNHVLDLSSYLLKPVQRIMKYHLILEKLLKYAPQKDLNYREELNRALKIMERVPRYANDVIHLMGLEGYSGNIENLGQLHLQEHFQVYINGQRKSTPRQVFIFEHAILFSKPISSKPHTRPRKTSSLQQPKYQFKSEVMLHEVGLSQHLHDESNIEVARATDNKMYKKWRATTEPHSPLAQRKSSSGNYCNPKLQFQIDVFKNGNKNCGESYIVQAATPVIRTQWVDKIESLLFAQFERLKNRAASNVL